MINSIMLAVLCILTGQSADQTALSAAERFFYRNDFQHAAEILDLHQWTDESLWSKAGLIRELCDGGWGIECPLMPSGNFHLHNSSVTIFLRGEFQSGDSVRVIIPIPAVLPWQMPLNVPDVAVTGIAGSAEILDNWLFIEGISEGTFEVTVTQEVNGTPATFAGVEAHGNHEAMVPFPGEDPFWDECLKTDDYWIGEDAVYRESVRLASSEPNPMFLVKRIIEIEPDYYTGFSPVPQQALLNPLAEMALAGELHNSLGGASLGAAILRRWQIPAIVVPGRWGDDGKAGYILGTYVKPFGWMIISPCPDGFIALGNFDSPNLNSWNNGLAGISIHAEFLSDDGFWHAVPANSPGFSHSVKILTR